MKLCAMPALLVFPKPICCEACATGLSGEEFDSVRGRFLSLKNACNSSDWGTVPEPSKGDSLFTSEKWGGEVVFGSFYRGESGFTH